MSPRQDTPSQEFEGSPDELSSRLHSIALHLLRRARKDDVDFGLSAARLSALSVLAYGGPQRLTRLAELEQVRPSTMSRMVNAMQSDGLVTVRVARSDARAREIRATARGKRLLDEARVARVGHLQELLAGTSVSERRQINRALEVLSRLLQGG